MCLNLVVEVALALIVCSDSFVLAAESYWVITCLVTAQMPAVPRQLLALYMQYSNRPAAVLLQLDTCLLTPAG